MFFIFFCFFLVKTFLVFIAVRIPDTPSIASCFFLIHVCLFWWFESYEDIYHPTPLRFHFNSEITQAEMNNCFATRQTCNDIFASFDMVNPGPGNFHLLCKFSHSLTYILDYVEHQLSDE